MHGEKVKFTNAQQAKPYNNYKMRSHSSTNHPKSTLSYY